ncbi:hypothetical protein O3Q52_44080 [Streptomyces sp. ActVer]|uniref:hypothetical protein n=1 Tax=Streptomyces sp. ActVer TaxID=3014558 RepID=UPI0022B3F83F|nr:hypothetical protein [Streptomyces sp. ActVer]MCZ4514981.1 hypothetical protein [Streptomyces sp. ActVer]
MVDDHAHERSSGRTPNGRIQTAGTAGAVNFYNRPGQVVNDRIGSHRWVTASGCAAGSWLTCPEGAPDPGKHWRREGRRKTFFGLFSVLTAEFAVAPFAGDADQSRTVACCGPVPHVMPQVLF